MTEVNLNLKRSEEEEETRGDINASPNGDKKFFFSFLQYVHWISFPLNI